MEQCNITALFRSVISKFRQHDLNGRAQAFPRWIWVVNFHHLSCLLQPQSSLLKLLQPVWIPMQLHTANRKLLFVYHVWDDFLDIYTEIHVHYFFFFKSMSRMNFIRYLSKEHWKSCCLSNTQASILFKKFFNSMMNYLPRIWFTGHHYSLLLYPLTSNIFHWE